MPQVDIRLVSQLDAKGFEQLTSRLKTLHDVASGKGSGGDSVKQGLLMGLGISAATQGVTLLKSAIKESAVAAFEMADKIEDGARSLGISTNAYQVLSVVLEEAGGNAEMLGKMVSKSNLSLYAARDASSSAAASYRALGLNVAEMAALPAEKRFEEIGKAILRSGDQTKAFAAASEILGSKNLPVMLAALKDLAADGYGSLDAAMLKSGRIMSESTIARLHDAELEIKKFKREVTIGTGEAIGAGFALGDAAKINKLGTLGALLKASFMGPAFGMGSLGEFAAKTIPQKATEPKPPDDGSAAKKIALTEAMTTAEHKLAMATLERNTVENDPNTIGLDKMYLSYAYMQKELQLRLKLLETAKAAGAEDGESSKSYELRIAKQEATIKDLKNRIRHNVEENQFNRQSDETRDKFKTFNTDKQGSAQTVGSGLQDGAMDFIMSMGSASQQAAEVMKTTLGSAVDGISSSMAGLLRGTMSWGSALRNIGGSILNGVIGSISRMFAQWVTGKLMTFVLDKTLGAASAAAAIAIAAPTAMALTALWVGPATLASIATLGAADVAGVAGMSSALLTTRAMTLVPGYDVGGYTANGPRNRVAGVVHAGEWVAPQWLVNSPHYAPMIAGLEAARQGRSGFETGGFAAPSMSAMMTRPGYAPPRAGRGSSAASQSGGQDAPAINQNFAFFNDEPSAREWLRKTEGSKFIIDVVRRNRHEIT